MGWDDYIEDHSSGILPWVGGRRLYSLVRVWEIAGDLPREHGWYKFYLGAGRVASVICEADSNPAYYAECYESMKGYVVGDRIIPDSARVELDPDKLIAQTERIFLVEPGLDRFTRASAVKTVGGSWIYMGQEFPEGPEPEVTEAYQDRKPSLDHIKGVTPALHLAFNWLTLQRDRAEQRAEARRLQLEAEERRRELAESTGSAVGRRRLAQEDFAEAAKASLALSGAELLDAVQGTHANEMIVHYRFRNRRLACAVHKETLQILDAGVCLTDHATGESGDARFTLESLPPVIGQAIDEHKLVIWDHLG